MADRFLGIFRHQALQLGLGVLVIVMRLAGAREDRGELGPGIGCSHINDPNRLEPRFGRLDPKQLRLLAALDAARAMSRPAMKGQWGVR